MAGVLSGREGQGTDTEGRPSGDAGEGKVAVWSQERGRWEAGTASALALGIQPRGP